MQHPIYLVDAFASHPFTGNPAGVMILDAPLAEETMQRIAMEMNQAETAFLWPLAEGYTLRWFTPEVEVDLCGHATLASAHVLFSQGYDGETLSFETRSGRHMARRLEDGIELRFPRVVTAPASLPIDLPFLTTAPKWTGRNERDWLIELASASDVRDLKPDFPAISALGGRGLIVTAVGDGGFDFVSRGFFPAVGIPEDPATGSAHCALAPYWAERLGQRPFRAYQASRRGGYLEVEDLGDVVALRGRAFTALVGSLTIESFP